MKGKNTLWIKCPNYAILLFNEEIPFSKYPELLLENRPGPYFIPSYSFQIYISILVESIPLNSIILFFNITHSALTHFPKVGFAIPKSILGKDLSVLFEIMVKNFGKGIYPKEVFDGGKKVETSNSIRSIYKASINSEWIVRCDIDEVICEMMKKHDNVVKEIIMTEKPFIDSIQTIVDIWHPKLKALGILTKDEEDLIFKNFPSILAYHRQRTIILVKTSNIWRTNSIL